MDIDPLMLSRIQFAFTISFHILFPAFTIGLANWIMVLEGLWLRTGRDVYRRLSEFWTKIFAISFGMGVVSGIVMSYQFGTNWSRWSDITGNVLGPLIQYEVITAFFLEAAFLGILLFGRDKVPRGMHFFAALMVAMGTIISSFWILSSNSWLHTPAGFEIRDGRFFVTSWWEVVFNPSFPYRLAHMVTAAFLTTSFVIAGISAWYMLKGRFPEYTRINYPMAMGMIVVLAPLQILLGDLHGLKTMEMQPAKIAAMEGHWEGGAGAPLILFALPDMAAEENHYEIGIPYLSSLILTHELDGVVPGLKEFAPEDRPYMPIVFWTFRIMVGIGFLMLFVGAAYAFLRWRGRAFETRWLHWLSVAMTPAGFVAIIAGWFTTEIGRQPWMVQGLVRTADGVTPSLTAGGALTSLVTFMVTYALIFTAGTYYILRLLQLGPQPHRGETTKNARLDTGRPKRPLSATDEAIEPAE
ncbi:cytochrome D ubiquinol oxidase subunit I [Skermanella stibiiresistens SB22]|uniref:Cytochrome D ubiquinol oxidase subunit I n=1 Tax=Skermanella stibiiresistens SB22 TaxID=1385369 RepID=W9GZL3_9PROT|nr:cytochrome ubiquinol oxidase subunit I [Skermanella stibiiresistens]EWY38036.1 cytochrome D ubiquinol oxidase subunit I [Skermanella stibiiresistens SB22]